MSIIEANAPLVKPAPESDATVADLRRALAERPTGLASTATYRFLHGERPTASEWAAEIAEADALVENSGDYQSAAVWPEWTDEGFWEPGPAPAACCDLDESNPCASCSPDPLPPEDGEGHGAPGEDLGPADPADEWGDDAPNDDGARLSLVGYLEYQRDRFQRVGSSAAGLVAEAISELLSEAIILGSPVDAATFRTRRDAYAIQSS